MSLVVTIIVGFSIWIGGRSQWLNYQMNLSFVDLIVIEIPSIIWEMEIYGFTTGFLYVLFIDVYDTYKDIKYLDELRDEIELGYYPKELNKLYKETVKEIKSSFISVSKGFLLWYAVIIGTAITSLQLHPFIPLVATIAEALLLASFIFFRLNPLSLIGIEDSPSTNSNVEQQNELADYDHKPSQDLPKSAEKNNSYDQQEGDILDDFNFDDI